VADRGDRQLPRASRGETVQAWLGISKPRDAYVPPFPWLKALLALGVVAVAVAVLVSALVEDKGETQARERREKAAADARTRARLAREQAPHRIRLPSAATAGVPAAELPERRRRMIEGLERAITADALARRRAGSLSERVSRTDCVPYVRPRVDKPPQPPLHAARGRYECLAVIGDVPASERSEGGSAGYPFWARVDFRRGGAVWCRIHPRPAEGATFSEVFVPLPRVCQLDRGP
jgi:hypothetical protein